MGGGYITFNNSSNIRRIALFIRSTLVFRLLSYLLVLTLVLIFLVISDVEANNVQIIVIVMLAGLFQGLDLYQHFFNGALFANSSPKCTTR